MRLTIGKKLGLGFAVVIMLAMVSALLVYLSIKRMQAAVDRVNNKALPTVRAADDLLTSLMQAVAALRGYIILGNDPKHALTFKQERQTGWKNVDAAWIKLEVFFKDSNDPEEKRLLALIQDNLDGLRKAQQHVEDNAQSPDKATKEKAIEGITTQTAPRTAGVRENLEQLKQSATRRMTDEQKNVDSASAAATTTLIVSKSLAVVVSMLIAFLLSRHIVVALQSLLSGVQRISSGNLTGQALDIRSRDEVADLSDGFNQMVDSLRSLLSEISGTTAEVAVSCREITASAQQQLTGLNQTAASLNQIAATSEEFKTTMREFVDRARAVTEAAAETGKRTADGRSLTQESAGRMERVRSNAQTAGQSVLNLSEQIQRIGEITATVHEIAEQTKLLALNASIEAARAGENGRGFAVVAAHVRELANQSKESAGRIESLIADTQKSTQAVVQKIQEGSNLSEDSAGMVRRVAQAFEEITRAVDQTREAMTQISIGSRQQEQGITELAAGITQIDIASKASVASAEQTQKSIVGITQRIHALNQTVAKFKT